MSSAALLLLIPLAWLAVTLLVVAACRATALAETEGPRPPGGGAGGLGAVSSTTLGATRAGRGRGTEAARRGGGRSQRGLNDHARRGAHGSQAARSHAAAAAAATPRCVHGRRDPGRLSNGAHQAPTD